MKSQRVIAYGLLAASMVLVGSYVGLSKLLVAVFPVVPATAALTRIAAFGYRGEINGHGRAAFRGPWQ